MNQEGATATRKRDKKTTKSAGEKKKGCVSPRASSVQTGWTKGTGIENKKEHDICRKKGYAPLTDPGCIQGMMLLHHQGVAKSGGKGNG